MKASHLEFAPPPQPGRARAWVVAGIAHGLLFLALALATAWKTQTVKVQAEAELWSAMPQAAAPKLNEPPPQPAPEPEPQVEPKPTPAPQAAKKQVAPTVDPEVDEREAQIALEKRQKEAARLKAEKEKEKAAKEKAQKEKLRKEKALKEKAQKDLALKEKEEKEKAKLKQKELEKEALAKKEKVAKASKEKTAKEKLALEQEALEQKREAEKAKAEQEQAERTQAMREENLKRMQGMAGASGGATATGSALKSSGPSASYAGRLVGRIKPNITYTAEVTGNPRAEVEVKVSPDGTILSRKIVQPSGNKAWDDAVLRAIDKTEVLPKDTDGRVPPLIVLGFRPLD